MAMMAMMAMMARLEAQCASHLAAAASETIEASRRGALKEGR